MHARADVEKSADSMLVTGMESKNQNQMALALQVIFIFELFKPYFYPISAIFSDM